MEETERERFVPRRVCSSGMPSAPCPALPRAAVPRTQGCGTLTLSDVTQTLGVQQVPQPGDLVLEFADEFVVGVFIDDSVTADLLGPVSIPKWAGT